MTGPTPLTRAIDAQLARLAALPQGPARLEAQLRQLAKWRSIVLANTLLQRGGGRVAHGPFAGMLYPVAAAEGGRAPRLLGVYEASLHPVIETVIARPYAGVIDIGSAEGYYAVGLALRMPAALIHARDTNPAARDLCGQLARANGVEDRLQIGGEVTHADLALCAEGPTLSSAISRAPRPNCSTQPAPRRWPRPTCWSRCMRACARASLRF